MPSSNLTLLQYNRAHSLWFVDYQFVYGTQTVLCADLYAAGLIHRVQLFAPGATAHLYAPGVVHIPLASFTTYKTALADFLEFTPVAAARALDLAAAARASIKGVARAVTAAERLLALGQAPRPKPLTDAMARMMTFSNLNYDLGLPTWLEERTERPKAVQQAMEPLVTPFLRVLAERAHALVTKPTPKTRARYVQQAAFLSTFDMRLQELPTLEDASAHAERFAIAPPSVQRPTHMERENAIRQAARNEHQAALLRLAAVLSDHEEARHYWQARGLITMQRAATCLNLNPETVSVQQLEDAYEVEREGLRGGGKAAGLRRLVAWGVPTPRFAVLAAKQFAPFAEQIGLATTPASSAPGRSVEELRAAAATVPLPSEIRAQIATFAAGAKGLVAVRSSSAGEDGEQRSAAGIHLSLPAVTPTPDALERSVKAVWLSALTPEALAYHGAPAPMSVILQDSINASASGVAFVRHDGFEVESAFGQGLVLVGGYITPDVYQYCDGAWEALPSREKRGAVIHATAAIKKLKPGDSAPLPGRRVTGSLIQVSGNLAVLRLGPQERSLSTLTPEALQGLSEVLHTLLPHAGPQGLDVEWAVESERVYVLQARPITVAPAPRRLAPSTSPLDIAVLADGTAAGEVTMQGNGQVLLLDQVVPADMPRIAQARGVLVQQGGALSHGAILCRELGIPLLRVPADLASTLVGRHVTINTANTPPLTTEAAT